MFRVRLATIATLAAAVLVAGSQAIGAEPAPAGVVALAKSTIARLGTAPEIVKAVKAQNAAGATLAEVQTRDKTWIATPGVAAYMTPLMDSEAGVFLRRTAAAAPYYSELFVTDRLGATVAMSAKTSDYWQGDEPKFTTCWNGGSGVLAVSDITFDKSAQRYIVHVSVPVKDGGTTIGVLIAGVDVDKVPQPSSGGR